MSTITTVAFEDGDFVVRNGTFVLIHDAEAVLQSVRVVLQTQIAMNQYAPSSGWNWMHWQGVALSDDDLSEISSQLRDTCEAVPYVRRADVSYLGYLDGEFSFSIDLETSFGTTSLDYTLGGSRVQL